MGRTRFPVSCAIFRRSSGKKRTPSGARISVVSPTRLSPVLAAGAMRLEFSKGFVGKPGVRLIGVEPAGRGIPSGRHGATLLAGSPGLLHGARTYVLQDASGQIEASHSMAAGLDYPGVGPEHAFLKDSGRAEYHAMDDDAGV